MDTIDRLCHERATNTEAKKLYRLAQKNTAQGSGFDLGQDRIALPAVCAFLASQNLNNTHVTQEAAQIASCQRPLTFKKLCNRVQLSLAGPKAAQQKQQLLEYSILREQYRPTMSSRAHKWMERVEVRVLEDLDTNDDSTEDEIKIAVFIWACNIIEPEKPLHAKSFKDKYQLNTMNMKKMNTLITNLCGGDLAEKISDDVRSVQRTRSATSSPQKSPTRPVRTFASRNSPQKRAADAEDDMQIPESPSKRPKIAPNPGIVTRESLRLASPSKPKPLPSPSKSPLKKLTFSSSDDEDEDDMPPPPRRRFRPVYRDTVQWNMRDPRIAIMDKAAVEFNERMVKRYGLPFQDARGEADGDVAMDSE